MPESSPPDNKVAFISSDEYLRHLSDRSHVECPQRLIAIKERLVEDGLWEQLEHLAPRMCSQAEASLVHTQDYLNVAERDVKSGMSSLSTGDTDIDRSSWDVACLAAGGVLSGVDAIFQSDIKMSFCAVRPPGHHATPTQGMGFCLLSNVAIAARYAQTKYQIGKVLIVDWDVHHGNGTQDAFYEDDSVFFFSTHQHPWYPGTGMEDERGTGRGLGTTLNVPLPAGTGADRILSAYADSMKSAVDRFRPELVIISAGFDSRRGDPLGKFRLDDPDFATLTQLLQQIAAEHAEGRLISVLEGGYRLEGVAAGVAAHIRALLKS